MAVAKNSTANKLLPEDRPAHDWYRFVLSFPPHIVREYLDKFSIGEKHCVLDPFCGTGTTIVECKKQGIQSVGIEANPMAHLACRVKTSWNLKSNTLLNIKNKIAAEVYSKLEQDRIPDIPLFEEMENHSNGLLQLSEDQTKLILKNSISPLPLHKVLILLQAIENNATAKAKPYLKLALAKSVVNYSSNLHFGPEVGIGKIKPDAPVIGPWESCVEKMADDLETLNPLQAIGSKVIHGDSRNIKNQIESKSIDFVFTSPPYPNEKDYTRTTRLESVLLGFMSTRADLKSYKQNLIRSNTRNVYKHDTDDNHIEWHKGIQEIAKQIESRRIELGKTSGFERQYARVTKLYFGGMAKHLEQLKPLLKPGAILCYVVGDQASYLRVMIRTGELLAQIAESLGYEVMAIDLFRTRLSTATKQQLREEVLLLRWKG